MTTSYLPTSALAHTHRGLVQIKDLGSDDKVLTSKGYSRVIRVFEPKIRTVTRIETTDGYFDCANRHQLAITSDAVPFVWKEAADLREDSDHVISAASATEGVHTTLPERMSARITVPELDANLAWFLALYQMSNTESDWNMTIGITTDDVQIAAKAQREMKRFCPDLDVRIDTLENLCTTPYGLFCAASSDRGKWCVFAWSKRLGRYLRKCTTSSLNIHAYGDFIPEYIMRGTIDVRLGYLTGLTCARHGNRDIMAPTFGHLTFARTVQALAYSCGLASQVIHLNPGCGVRMIDYLPSIHNFDQPPGELISKHCLRASKKIELRQIKVNRVICDAHEDETCEIEVEAGELFCNGYLTRDSLQINT